MPVVWTGRPLPLPMIAGMAPDYGTWRAADTLARSGKESRRGRLLPAEGALLWAEFSDSRRPAARASVLLPHLVVSCTCPSNAFPCRHVLALLLLDHTDPAASATAAPEWAAARLATGLQAARAGATTAGDAGHPPAARQEAVAAGLAGMARRLRDEVGRGLATGNRSAWLAAADQLDDAYAPAVACELRRIAALPGAGDAGGWPEQLLPRLGRLMLLAEAFDRLGELPPGEQGDALAAAGCPPPPDGSDRVDDTWLALGRHPLANGRRGTWLRGLASGRWALLEEPQPAGRPEGRCFPAGARLVGALAFLPSAWPLAAEPLDGLRLVDGPPGEPPPAGQSIAAAVAANAAARAANPWLSLVPMLLADVFVEPAPDGWRLRDRQKHLLPLPAGFDHGWQLLALAGDRPLALCGVWDGVALAPLSAHTAAGWHDLAGWKGLP